MTYGIRVQVVVIEDGAEQPTGTEAVVQSLTEAKARELFAQLRALLVDASKGQ